MPQRIFDNWVQEAPIDKAIQARPRQVLAYQIHGADMKRATNRLAEFDKPALMLWSDNPVMPRRTDAD